MTLDEADAYFLGEVAGGGAWWTSDEGALIQACSLLEAHCEYIGTKATQEQALKWPRINAWDQDGYLIDSAIIPPSVKKAQLELAGFLVRSDRFSALVEAQTVKSLELGPLKVEFADEGASEIIPEYIFNFLSALLSSSAGGGIGASAVVRA